MIREKIFLDTEFTTLRQSAQLISLGIMAESGKSFYAEFTDFSQKILSPWHFENVIAFLSLEDKPEVFFSQTKNEWIVKGNQMFITRQLRSFLKEFGPIECWIDYTAYDWVLFCELFGGSMNLPSNLYYIPFDLMTLLKLKGVDPDISREEFVKKELVFNKLPQRHNALGDAQLLKLCVEYLLPSIQVGQ